VTVPDEMAAVPLSKLFIKPDGSPRSRDEALKAFGKRAVWLAELHQALEVQLAGPPPLSVPPRIFLSYRWADDVADEWVAMLAAALRQRGYVVVFDRTDKPEDLSVPEFVARIAECHWFLAILDPGYQERIGTAGIGLIRDGWVFDEYNTAKFLSNEDRIRILGLVRAGDLPSSGFRLPVPGRSGNAVDVRDADKLARVLDQLFPPPEGVPPQSQLAAVRRLIRASHEAVADGRLDAAIDLAERAAAACPEIADGHAQLARACVFSNRFAEGLEAARRALAIERDSAEMTVHAAEFAYQMQQPTVAARYCVAILERDDREYARRWVGGAQHVLGNVLDDAGHCYPGIARLEIARRLTPDLPVYHQNIGVAYRHVDDIDAALACFAAGLELDPEDTGLLVNQAAAFIEAGKSRESREALHKLAAIEPEHPAVDGLARILDAWRAQGGPPPRLVPRMARRRPVRIVTCTECPARIPLADNDAMLCAGCGAEREPEIGRCEICGHDGYLFLAISGLSFICPYCREGVLQIASAAP